ncbi:MAG: hypothetical protein IPF58_16025 [Saprospirales bacterium]|nr:hypothetical protein [Saprospirales bacterium]
MIRHRHLVDINQKECTKCCIFIRKDQLKTDEHTYIIETHSIGKQKNLISSDYFYNERFLKHAAGTCFAKDYQTISTAYHIINATGLDVDLFIENYFVLFGYTNSSEEVVSIHANQIIELDSVIYSNNNLDADFIDFKIKKELPSFVEIPKAYNGELKPDMEIYVAGYPLRSSLTISGNAVINKKYKNHFTTYADLFEYSSGSPVFLKQNNQLIGFVKGSGENDFVETEDKEQQQTNVIESSKSNGKKILFIR